MKWTKLGRIFDPRDHQRWWLHEFSQAPATLLFDDRVRVYFSGRPRPHANGNYESYTGFADFDRRDPTRLLRVSDEPILSLGKLGTFDEFGTYPVSVIRDRENTRCYYAGWNHGSARFDTAIGVAIGDAMGETFDKLSGGGPVLGTSLYEPFVLSGPKIRRINGEWLLFYIAGREWRVMADRPEPIYKIRSAVSDDGFRWRRHSRDLIASNSDEVQSGPDVHWDGEKFVMLFCFRPVGHHPGRDGGLRIGYAWSRDAVVWTRDDAQAGITVSDDPNAWDYGHVRYPHWFLLDGEEYLLYNGNSFGRYGFGLARRVE
jgi:hypothetical protein